jgi:hypothetical protein
MVKDAPEWRPDAARLLLLSSIRPAKYKLLLEASKPIIDCDHVEAHSSSKSVEPGSGAGSACQARTLLMAWHVSSKQASKGGLEKSRHSLVGLVKIERSQPGE